MRVQLLVALLIFCINAQAYEITCYSGKKRIYHGYGDGIQHNDRYLAFTEDKTNNFIIIDADCIIMKEIEKGKYYAFSKRPQGAYQSRDQRKYQTRETRTS